MSQVGYLYKNSHGIISIKPGARRALHCMVPPQYLRPGSSNVETKSKLLCLYFDRFRYFDMAASKQANAGCSYFTKCQLIPSLGETALLRKQFEAQRSRSVCSKKIHKTRTNWRQLERDTVPLPLHSVQFECIGNTFGEGITLKVFMMRSGYSSRI